MLRCSFRSWKGAWRSKTDEKKKSRKLGMWNLGEKAKRWHQKCIENIRHSCLENERDRHCKNFIASFYFVRTRIIYLLNRSLQFSNFCWANQTYLLTRRVYINVLNVFYFISKIRFEIYSSREREKERSIYISERKERSGGKDCIFPWLKFVFVYFLKVFFVINAVASSKMKYVATKLRRHHHRRRRWNFFIPAT